ncbi:hypothetical protein FB45DRAFT_765123 [Roridomyces roridus]|uniref:Uncharacterized protein n=1 Tax=Roridomyces roridus TaxID=1738132 RepID=A0AAD7B110_9AGAR|nr:hypothetical protein FB45DRAFT_765123 [Roridomyces roridus]
MGSHHLLSQAARALQAKVHDSQQAEQEQARNALADVSNQQDGDDEDRDDQDTAEVAHIKRMGKKLTWTKLLWAPDDDLESVFTTDEDSQYNPKHRFGENNQPFNRIQGALRDVHAVIGESYRNDEEFTGWVLDTVWEGMRLQRAQIGHRLRHNAAMFDQTTHAFNRARADGQFRELIGERKDENGNPYFDSYRVSLIHDDYDMDEDELNPSTIFLNPYLFTVNLQVHALVTPGVASTESMKEGTARAKARSNERNWNLCKTTPGMIAASAVCLRWLFSPDPELTPTGAVTNIDWNEEFERYLEYLGKRTRSVKNIFKTWDAKFYPRAERSGTPPSGSTVALAQASHAAALRALEEEEEEEEEEEAATRAPREGTNGGGGGGG